MSYSNKEHNEDVDALVNTLTICTSPHPEGNISLTTTDFQQLAELSQELHLTNEMETEDTEVIIDPHSDSIEIEEEIVETEIGAEEIEIESERIPSPEEILPDLRAKPTVPPLRPLTIAPKPTKLPITLKSVGGGGQQLLLLQGTGANQTIKLLSPQGQELNLANLTLARPIPIKPATTVKTITASQGNISMMPQKQVMKKVIPTSAAKSIVKPTLTFTNKPGHYMVVQKTEQNTPIKLVQSTSGLTQIGQTKTITLQQAQEMGILSGAKLIPQTQSTPKHTVLLNKGQTKTIKIVPQVNPTQIVTSVGGSMKTIALNQIKSPTKILPANKLPQHIIYKKSGSNQTILPPGQIIQVSGSQPLSSGQLHQINIPGKGMQYIKFVPATTAAPISSSGATVTTKTNLQSSLHTSTANIVLTEIQPSAISGTVSPTKTMKPMVVNKSVGLNTQVVMFPSYITTTQASTVSNKVAIPKQTPTPKPVTTPESQSKPSTSTETSVDANGMRPRKPCNCTKSQCLKLYCDCFANGEFCYMCNCMNCYNNLENEENRQRAIRNCLERNPNAFRPKIGKAKDMAGDMSIRKHTKGCNCKRSGCLKNYCECYEAKIACSSNCKCIGCRNIEDSMEKKSLRNSGLNNGVTIVPIEKIAPKLNASSFRAKANNISNRQAINFITDDVIEATCHCLLTYADRAAEKLQDTEATKREIIEEFGRCLTKIIECSTSRSLNL